MKKEKLRSNNRGRKREANRRSREKFNRKNELARMPKFNSVCMSASEDECVGTYSVTVVREIQETVTYYHSTDFEKSENT